MYDALLLVSFGGPEGPDDVMPFLRNVTRGRNVPEDRLAEVARHYQRFGGVSPINQQCRELKAAIESALAARGLEMPVYWGNRNWNPLLADTLRQMTADGVRRAMAFVTSAYSGYSCCRQYRDDIARARAEAGDAAPVVDKPRAYFNHPGFAGPVIDHTRAALGRMPGERPRLIFTAHSVPLAQPGRADYVGELTDLARHVAGELGLPWDLVYQSRSGPPSMPWLEPDICDHLENLGDGAAVMVPLGFVSDHMEVAYDLDIEAAELAGKLGIRLERAATPGTHPRFAALAGDLMLELAAPGSARPAVGGLGPRPDDCAAGCCEG